MTDLLTLPRMSDWRYQRLGACPRCGNDEAPGVRLFRRRVEGPRAALEQAVCARCARDIDGTTSEAER